MEVLIRKSYNDHSCLVTTTAHLGNSRALNVSFVPVLWESFP